MKKIETVKNQLRARICAKEWGPEQSLPSKSQISKEYGVSPASVSVVMQQLQKEGLIHIIPSRGAFLSGTAEAVTLKTVFPRIGLRGSYLKASTQDGTMDDHPASYAGSIIRSLWQAAHAKHCPLLLLPGTVEEGPLSKPYCQSQGIQGVIFLGGESYQEAVNLRLSGFPVITANEPPGPTAVNYVNHDHAQALRQIVARLAEAGHRRIGVVFPRTTMPGSYDKLKSDFIQALCDADIYYNVNEYWRIVRRERDDGSEIDPDLQKPELAIETLLNLPEPPTAIFCSSYYMLKDIRCVLERRGLSVPQDISLVGATYSRPQDATVSGFLAENGKLAEELLQGVYDTIQNPFHSLQKLIPLTFLDRGSIAAPRLPRSRKSASSQY